MTEDEARQKWCPFARIYENNGVNNPTSYNRYASELGNYSQPQNSHCIGSECMMWRTKSDFMKNSGYCGLANNKIFYDVE